MALENAAVMLDLNTLTLYLLAGGLSISLSLVLWAFAYFQPGTRLLKGCAMAILMLSAGFTVSGFGPDLPRWMTVIGTNMLLISASVVLHTAFAAYCQDQPARPDPWGWGVVALTALPFWYWGLVEPDGHYRSAVFSLAAAVINGRTALLLAKAARQKAGNAATWALALLFGVLTVWMAARGVLSLLAEPAAQSLRGANPTSWKTVFWYIVLVSMMTVCFIWLELSRPATSAQEARLTGDAAFSWAEFFGHRLRLLWGTVLVLVLGIASESGVYYAQSYAWEKARLIQATAQANDAFVQHSLQVVNQIDTLLYSVRSFYLHTGSVAETESFINALPFDKSTIDNIYLISPQATLLISHDPAALGRSLAERDYIRFHRTTQADQAFFASVETGRVTGELHFRISRRITHPDGSFAGIVLATVNPESFSRYYRDLAAGEQNIASLLGTLDKKLRARAPAPLKDRWQVPIESPIWAALQLAPTGSYASTSGVDNIERIFVYKKVADLPLVMVTGFSQSDLQTSVQERVHWLLAGALTVVAAVLVLAMLLTVEIRRRNEQNSFMSMLSHELKTPLSVLRMALDSKLSPGIRQHAQQSVLDMDAIVERCLQVDRLQQKRYTLKALPCNLADLLDECRSACQAPQRLVLEAPGLPVFSTDTQLLRIALGNLIDNALKYAAPASPVQVSAIGQTHRKQPGVLVSVSNAPGNAGMPDPQQVFKKYYRSPGAHSKTGSGLGLHLVHSIARLLGGWVRYSPSANTCRFELWLPC
ncbi:MAG: hypothetical protein JZU64_07970 [Rhodoferax sp.]|nr:hypothetical protein [Rhodoferax sp.]